MQNTVAVECSDAGAHKNLPKHQYRFQPISTILKAKTNEKVDLIGICTQAQDLKEVTKRSGGQVNKREIVVMSDKFEEINVTLWAEKAEVFVGLNKIVTIKSAFVNEWNDNKSVSVSFGADIEIEPNLPEVERLKEWYQDNFKSLDRTVSISSNSSQSDLNSACQSLAEIKMEYLAFTSKFEIITDTNIFKRK